MGNKLSVIPQHDLWTLIKFPVFSLLPPPPKLISGCDLDKLSLLLFLFLLLNLCYSLSSKCEAVYTKFHLSRQIHLKTSVEAAQVQGQHVNSTQKGSRLL